MTATGDDTDINLTLDGKGTGTVRTLSSDLDITGAIVVSGLVDGIDIATDVAANTAKTGVTTEISDILEDTTPELGGELDCGAHTIGFTAQAATGDGTTTIDWKLGNVFNFLFGAFSETFTFTAPTNPGDLILKLTQDGGGSRTATWPSTVLWSGNTAPPLTAAGGSVDLIRLYFDGTNYLGSFVLDLRNA